MLKTLSPFYSHLVVFTIGFFVCLISFNHWQNKTTDMQVTLNGPSQANVGEILEYDASVNDKSLNIIFQWQVLRDGKETSFRSISNNSVIFGSGQRNNRSLVLLGGVVVKKHFFFLTEVKPIKPIVKEVIVGDVPPGPDPTPNPNPNIPVDGKFKIATLAYQTALAKVSSPKRAQLFQDVSKNYLAVADRIAKGELATVQQVFSALKALNSPLFAGAYADVTDQYKQYDSVIQNFVYQLFTSKVLGPVSDYADLFREISQGLSCVK